MRQTSFLARSSSHLRHGPDGSNISRNRLRTAGLETQLRTPSAAYSFHSASRPFLKADRTYADTSCHITSHDLRAQVSSFLGHHARQHGARCIVTDSISSSQELGTNAGIAMDLNSSLDSSLENDLHWSSPRGPILFGMSHRQQETPDRYLRPPLPPTSTSRSKSELIDFSQHQYGHQSSKAQEQLSHLNVAVGIGDLLRAKTIILELEKSLGYIRECSFDQSTSQKIDHTQVQRSDEAGIKNLPTLHEVVNTSLFSGLLRNLLNEAIKQENLGNTEQQHKIEDEVYKWLLNFRYNGPQWARVDHHLLGGVLKGILFLKNPLHSALDCMPWVLPHSAAKDYAPPGPTSLAPTLFNILNSITFATSHTKSFFGKLDKHEALLRIKSQATAAGRDDVLKELALVESIWKDNLESTPVPKQPSLDVASMLTPVRKPSKSRDAPESDRMIPMRLNHLLSNVSTVSESSGAGFSNKYDRQMVLEYSGYDSAQAEWFEGLKETRERGVGLSNGDGGKVLQAWMWQWWHDLVRWFDQCDIDASKKAQKPRLQLDMDFRRVLDNSLLAKVAVVEVIREMTNSTITDGAKSIGLFIALGRSIENEWYAQSVKSIPELNKKLLQVIKSSHQECSDGHRNLDHIVRQLWKSEIGKYTGDLAAVQGEHTDWTINQRAKAGAMLMKGLLETAKIKRSQVLADGSIYEEEQPAFYQTTQYFDGKRVGVTKLNEAVAERLDRDPANVTLHPRYLPMISPPLPWTGPKNGAYLVHAAPFMRTKESPEQHLHVMEAHRLKGLDDIYQALDKLGQTPWTINRPVFDIMAVVWNSGKELAGIPVRDPHLNLNIPGLQSDFLDQDVEIDETQESPRLEGEKKEIYRSLLATRRSAYGQRCSVNYQLEIARAYLNETFYFPHNVDFRGRAYPLPANLNHIGDDISRGLLTFAERKTLGERGLFWLKVHLANKAGFDKASLEERLAFTEEHIQDIYDSADHPLEGSGWWLKSEDPWQTLAACIEVTEALRSDDPTKYQSYLPVHQDGSCNGLQHYAALGGDVEGGREVNLVPGERPGDVYSKVAAEVNKLVDQDAGNGHDIAKALKGYIKRKVVKQTVMTTVYGVTFVGAREQIRRQLKDLGVIPVPNLYISAAYIATLVLRSIGEVFRGAVAIQRWLTYVARLVSKSVPPERASLLATADPSSGKSATASAQKANDEGELMTSMTWTTPLGLVVCQPYRTQNRTQISTVLQTVYIADPFEPAQADSRGQASAFPPNFIHSLDATHMMLTALACKDITFASVHDSYWTHAADVDVMNVKLREAFVRLHSAKILENLANETLHRYAGYKIPRTTLSAKMMSDLKAMGVDMEKATSQEGRYIDLASLIPPLPPKGDLDIGMVLNSQYFFA